VVTTTFSAETSWMLANSSLSFFSPAEDEYFVFPSFMAWMAASIISSGVG
jgi:hypothetical protein